MDAKIRLDNGFGEENDLGGTKPIIPMKKSKKSIISLLLIASLAGLATGCSWSVGGGHKSVTMEPTVGQQLIDLQKARDSGAISESEYQAEKARLLNR